MAHSLIAGGRLVRVSCTVMTWRETGLQFRGLRKRDDTRHLVHHWTGGAGPARQVFRTLQSRTGSFGQPLRLSAHLCVEPDGTVYQFADLDMRCAHAGTVDDWDQDGHELSANAWSIGIEAVNPATIALTKPGEPIKVTLTQRNVTRQLVREEIHGVELTATTFTAEQVKAQLDLTRVICGHYGLPVAVPLEAGDVLARVMTEPEFLAFRGVLGHYMLTRQKRDPGLALMRAIAAMPLRGDDGRAE